MIREIPTKKMKVEIWSDVVCPFCYIGKRKFESALQQFEGSANVEVEWKSFLLDPAMKHVAGKKIHDVLAEKKGWSIEKAEQANHQVTQMAAEVGLKYDFDEVIPAGSFNAHKLTHLAAQYKLQDQATEELFRAYFIEGKNIEDADTLVQLGVTIGLKEDEIKNVLATDQLSAEVKADGFEAEELGIRGVPFFVFDRKYAISGAQPTEVFLSALQTTWAETQKESPALTTENDTSCQINGNC